LTLVDCLVAFAAEEQLAETDTWYCSECKEHVQAYKRFSISRCPKILVIQLKRFSGRQTFNRDKVNDLVRFPIHDFDISQFVEDAGAAGTPLVYDLFAISNHFGGLGGGHYTAFARNRNDTTKWMRFDDSSVSWSSEEQICSEASYVLFYVRKDVDWKEFVNEEEKEKKEEDSSPTGTLTPTNTVDDEYEPDSDDDADHTYTPSNNNSNNKPQLVGYDMKDGELVEVDLHASRGENDQENQPGGNNINSS